MQVEKDGNDNGESIKMRKGIEMKEELDFDASSARDHFINRIKNYRSK